MRFIPVFFLAGPLLLACGSKPDIDAYECEQWADFNVACIEVMEENFIDIDCHETVSSDWYDENGKLKVDDEAVMQEFAASLLKCETFDEFYDSCMAYRDAGKAAMAAAGNASTGEEEISDEQRAFQETADELIAAEDCTGLLEHYGILDEN